MPSESFTKENLIKLIDSESSKHIELLQALIRAPTPNPPGDTRAGIDVAKQFLDKVNISHEIIAPKPESPNLLSVLRGKLQSDTAQKSRTLVLNGHIDQFPVSDASQWQRDPYSGDVEDGFIHGRSGVDMKAGTAASIIAYAYLHKFQEQISGRCTLEVVSDEESGGRWGTRYLLEDDASEEWSGDCVLIGEPSGLDSIRFGEKGTLRMAMTVTAQGAHGAYTHRSEGAIRIAARLIEKLVTLEQLHGEGMDEELKRYMQQPEVRQVADEIMWPGAADAMLIPTVNIGVIQGGTKNNMIPSECVFEVDIRIPIGVSTESILARIDGMLIKDFPTASYAIHENHSHISTHSEPHHEVVDILQKNAELVRGGKQPVPICSLGATDCKHFRRHKIPAYAYGPHPRGMAERDEKVSIQEFLETVKIHTLTAWDYLVADNGA